LEKGVGTKQKNNVDEESKRSRLRKVDSISTMGKKPAGQKRDVGVCRARGGGTG